MADTLKRKAVFLAAQLALLAAASLPARAYYGFRDPHVDTSYFVKARVRYWFTSSSALTRAYYLMPASDWSPPTSDIQMGWTNEYKPMDASFPLVSLELQPIKGLSAGFEVGDNSFTGKFRQDEWLHANNRVLYLLNGVTWYSPQHRSYAMGRGRLTGRARQYAADAYLRVYKSKRTRTDDDFQLNHAADIFAGYSWYETSTRIDDWYAVYSTDFFVPTHPVGRVAGMDSVSRLRVYGWRGGFRDQIRISEKLYAESKLGFAPRAKFTGQDHWNLRSDLKDPSLRRKANGKLFDFSVCLSWKFWKQFELEGGYQVWSFTSTLGKEIYYYTDGSTAEYKMDKIKIFRKGAFLSLSWKY
ncbi:MAG TPA: hypothetical protein DCZ92_07025 [Elusimicrobia bacterium]|nr:MAG: hypothetical protein A2016_04940 [Elusimicrobia bacterium GWF2_62_30]HBA60558.1 hypothetical protein [Elusimicrobiota bacterium]